VVYPIMAQAVPRGSTVVLSITVDGTMPMGFRWRRGGATVANTVVDSLTSLLVMEDFQDVDVGSYSVVLTNQASYTPGVLSPRATISIVDDTDGDGIHDQLETDNGLDPNDAADALLDPDEDGMTTGDEFIAGTDFMDPLSYLKVDEIFVSGPVTLRFTARAGKTYTVEYADVGSSGPWFKLVDIAAQATDREETVLDFLPLDSRAYRLVTPGGLTGQ